MVCVLFYHNYNLKKIVHTMEIGEERMGNYLFNLHMCVCYLIEWRTQRYSGTGWSLSWLSLLIDLTL